MMNVRIAVDVVHLARAGVLKKEVGPWNLPMDVPAALEHDPPTVHVVTVTSDAGMWREEVHGGADACRQFIRGVRAGARLAGAMCNTDREWT